MQQQRFFCVFHTMIHLQQSGKFLKETTFFADQKDPNFVTTKLTGSRLQQQHTY